MPGYMANPPVEKPAEWSGSRKNKVLEIELG
jgi:hypothetical protein